MRWATQDHMPSRPRYSVPAGAVGIGASCMSGYRGPSATAASVRSPSRSESSARCAIPPEHGTACRNLSGMGRETESGLPIQPVYGPDALAGWDPATKLGEPGGYPFTRGPYASHVHRRPWTMRQYAGFGTAKESNARYHQLLADGTTGLSVAFDLPTQMGFDSDDPLAHGEVGKVGVAIDSIDDMRTLFDGIPLDKVSTSMTINAPAALLLLLYQLVGEEHGDQRRRS